MEKFQNDLVEHIDVQGTGTLQDAHLATAAEHDTTLRQALKQWKWAVAWSLVVSMSIIMEGYDTALIGNLYGYPAFIRAFGTYSESSGYQLSGQWQIALGVLGSVGAFVGALLNGYFLRHFGFRPVFMGSLVLMAAFIPISVFGNSVSLQVVGQALCGLPWGIFATMGPAYASEILPLALRPYLTAYTNMCFAIGQFIAAGVLQGTINVNGEWSFRIPFAVQWAWPGFLLVLGFFMPESPWWLVRKGRLDKAAASVRRLITHPDDIQVRQLIALMEHTNAMEEAATKGSTYLDCFRGTNTRRTEIACVIFAGQVLSGSQFAYSSTYFFEQAGMSADNAYKLSLGGTAIAFVGTIASWFLMGNLGHRVHYLGGLAVMNTCLLIIGALSVKEDDNAAIWAAAAMCIIWLLAFSLSIGPVGWTIPAEVSSTRLRSKTIVLARNTYYVSAIVANFVEPKLINPTEANLRGKTGFVWFGLGTLTLIWGYFRMPETSRRTFGELDTMFEKRLPTRKFATYRVNEFAQEGEGGREEVVTA